MQKDQDASLYPIIQANYFIETGFEFDLHTLDNLQ